ncbi:MAG: hypothetical protein IKO55_14555, partial [Kiritimatiellae bacterium]|nr:hypothetical protein [Kiritimatiellia bacterium]
MEKKDRESERLRVEVTRKFAKMGIKRDRWLNLAESREFLATGKVPAGVLALRTFTKTPTMVQSLPNGSVCLCCGEDLSGKPGVIVEITGCAGPWLATICSADMMEIVTRARSAVPKAAPASVPAPAPVAQATVSALDTPQPAEKQAEPASAEKTDGENPTPQPSAVTGDFLAAVDGVRGWKARATPDAKN